MRGRAWTPFEIETLDKEFYKKGPSYLAEKLGRSYKSVQRRAEQRGLKSHHRKFNCNFSLFDQWNYSSAYLLGNIWADGSIEEKIRKSLRFRIKATDRKLIEFAKFALETKAKIHEHPEKQVTLKDGRIITIKPQVSLKISNPWLVNSLKNRGLEEAKSKKDLTFTNVPNEWAAPFFLGYCDGDACWNKRGCLTVYGTPLFLEKLRDLVCQNTRASPPNIIQDRPGKRLHKMEWGSIEDLRKLVPWMYAQEGFCLERKKSRAYIKLR